MGDTDHAGHDDRRAEHRTLTCVAAEVETPDKSSLALIKNVSPGGALLFVTRNLEQGERVELVMHPTGDLEGKKITATGSVARVALSDPARTDLWRWEVGIKFDDDVTLDDADLEAISQGL